MKSPPRQRRADRASSERRQMYKLQRRFLLLCCALWLALLFGYAWRALKAPSPAESPGEQQQQEQQYEEAGYPVDPHDDPFRQRAVWWHAPFLSGGGYSSEAVEYVVGLHKSGLLAPGRLWLSQHGDLESREVLEGMDRATQRDLLAMLSLAHSEEAWVSREAIVICHSVPGAWSLPDPLFQTSRCPPYPIEQAAYVIGRTMFETDSLPPDHVERCNMMHEIWLPTEFHRQLYRRCGVTKSELVVMPEPVDTQGFDPEAHAPLELPIGRRVFGGGRGDLKGGGKRGGEGQQEAAVGERPFVFLSIFKWEERKAWDVLLRAYLEEFGAHEQVMLLLLTKPFHQEGADFKQEMRSWAAKHLAGLPAGGSDSGGGGGSKGRGGEAGEGVDWGGLPAVYVQDDHVPQELLPRLYKAASAFVLPSRGEGWGRPHVEAMAMGLPVIATNWSGPTAFLDESVGYPLAIEGLVPADAGGFKGHKWAQPSVAHLRQLMRRVVAQPAEAAARGAAARRRMVERYAPSVVARLVAARLREIDGLLRGRPQQT